MEDSKDCYRCSATIDMFSGKADKDTPSKDVTEKKKVEAKPDCRYLKDCAHIRVIGKCAGYDDCHVYDPA